MYISNIVWKVISPNPTPTLLYYCLPLFGVYSLLLLVPKLCVSYGVVERLLQRGESREANSAKLRITQFLDNGLDSKQILGISTSVSFI